jgi:hypothetical protein
MKTFKPLPYEFPYGIRQINSLNFVTHEFFKEGIPIGKKQWEYCYVEGKGIRDWYGKVITTNTKSLEEAKEFIYYYNKNESTEF